MSSEKIGPGNFKLAGGGLVDRVSPKSKAGRKIFGFWIGMFAWAPLLILSLIEGTAFRGNVEFPFLYDPAPYARLLSPSR